MKASFFYIILMIASQQLLQAHSAFAQGLEKRVTIGADNETLTDVFRKLKTQTNLSFVFPATDSDEHSGITFKTEDRTVREVLDLALKGSGLTYTFKDNMVIIHDKPGEEAEDQNTIKENAVEKTDAPFFTITGTVKDASTQQPLPGVNVIVKGTIKGTSSNADGQFTIDAEDGDVLVFSFIGFKTFELPVSGRTAIDVAMEVEASALQEVVIHAGYYDVNEKEKTGSISKVTANVIANQPVSNPLQAMQGRMPGVYINQSTGVAGGNFQVRIRGTNSIANGNDPLYIIDGVPFISKSLSDTNTSSNLYLNPDGIGGVSPLNSVNPNDIESIEILKDADATAIYGSRGANGVVLITTKKGKAGGVKVSIDLKTGASKVTRFVDLMNTQQYLAMRNEAVGNDGDEIKSYEYDINGTWDQNRYTEWQKVFIGGTARMTDMNASISGGNTETQFLVGGGYNDQGVVFPGDNKSRRASTHFSVTHVSPNKKFDTRLSSSYIRNNSNLVSTDLTAAALQTPPNAPKPYDEDGNVNWENGTWDNPLGFLGYRFSSHVYNLLMNAELGYKIAKALQIKTSIGLNDIRNEERLANPMTTQSPFSHPTPASSSLRIAGTTSRSWIVEPQVHWERKVGKGKLIALVGFTYQSRTRESSSNTYRGFASDRLIDNPKAATSAELDYYDYSEYRYAALYSRINYNWDGKYIFNLTGRRDGSSRFGPGRKFANLGAVGIAWLFSNEEFAKNNIRFLSFGKVRASYGVTGNDEIGDYQYLDTYAAAAQYQGVPSLGPFQLFNPDYGWEVTKKVEGALELGFLDDNILLTIAYYLNRSSNQLIYYKLAATTGYPSILANSPATVQNSGLEVELTTVNLHKGPFKWTTAANITFPSNKLVAFPNLESSSYASLYMVGKPLTMQKVYHYLGVNKTTGIYEFADMNGDGEITPDDQRSVIVQAQQYFGGLNNSISYKRWQIDIFFQFVRQQGRRNTYSILEGSFASFGYIHGNLFSSALDGRWQNPGDVATKQYFSRDAAMQNSQGRYNSSDAVSMDINFVRLKNISISYQLPDKWIRSIKGRVYIQGQNLITLTNYDGLDPETGSWSLPPLTTVVGGVQFTL